MNLLIKIHWIELFTRNQQLKKLFSEVAKKNVGKEGNKKELKKDY